MRAQIAEKLRELDQAHLITAIHKWDEVVLNRCWRQLERFSSQLVQEQRDSFQKGAEIHALELFIPSEQEVFATGKQAIVILAGGEGSRLKAGVPKGLISISGKTIFERICNKLDKETPVAILTSPRTHQSTIDFFQSRKSLGLVNLTFCIQGSMPLLDAQGRWFWEGAGCIAEGSDGNGSLFEALAKANLLSSWEQQGVKQVNVIPIDQPLANPVFFGVEGADLTLFGAHPVNLADPMGRIAMRGDQMVIVEYGELSAEQRGQHFLVNRGLYTFELTFLTRLSKKKFPIHWVWRNSAWKGEKFITDALLYAERSRCLLTDSPYLALKDKNSLSALEGLLEKQADI